MPTLSGSHESLQWSVDAKTPANQRLLFRCPDINRRHMKAINIVPLIRFIYLTEDLRAICKSFVFCSFFLAKIIGRTFISKVLSPFPPGQNLVQSVIVTLSRSDNREPPAVLFGSAN